MQVHCPHCQTVFPADRPGVQSCPGCGRDVQVPDAEVFGAAIAQVEPQPNAWEKRRGLGDVRAFFQTWKEIMFSPTAFWRTLLPKGSVWDALSFAWLVSFVEVALNALEMQLTHYPNSLVRSLTENISTLSPETQELLTRIAAWGPPKVFAGYFAWLLFFPLWFFALSGVVHLACRICGCGKNGFNATARALGYSWAPLLLGWIPCLNVVAAVYWSVLQVWGIAQTQKAGAGQVVIAMFLVSLAACCMCLSPLAFIWPWLLHQ
jgi:hypothetical protein